MNIHELTTDQQVSFLTLTHKVAVIDGSVVPEENKLIRHLTSLFGSGVKVIAQEIFGESNSEHFKTEEERTFILRWMYLVALSDGHFHPNEISVIKEVLGHFGYDDEKAASIHAEAQAMWDSEYASMAMDE